MQKSDRVNKSNFRVNVLRKLDTVICIMIYIGPRYFALLQAVSKTCLRVFITKASFAFEFYRDFLMCKC